MSRTYCAYPISIVLGLVTILAGRGAAGADDSPQKTAETAPTPAAARRIAANLLQAMDQAAAAHEFDKAMEFARAAYTAAGKTGDQQLVDDVVTRGRQVLVRQKEFQQSQPTKGNPAGPIQEGEADPGDTAGRAKLAEEYWKRAEGKSDPQRKALLERAAIWYRKALPGLSGLARTKANQRLAVIKSLTQSRADTATTENPSPTAANAAKPSVGQWTDLLAQVLPDRHTVSGDWRVVGSRLEGLTSPKGNPRLAFPVTPAGSYELELRFLRKDYGTIGIALPVGPRMCVLALNYGEGANGIDTIDGKRANANPSTFQAALNNNRAYQLAISVRLDGTEVALTATLDGRPWVFYRGPLAGLAMHDDWKYPQRSIGLIVQSAAVFDVVKWRE